MDTGTRIWLIVLLVCGVPVAFLALRAARARRRAFIFAQQCTDNELRRWSIHDLEIVHHMFSRRLERLGDAELKSEERSVRYAYQRDRIAAVLDELRDAQRAGWVEDEKRKQR